METKKNNCKKTCIITGCNSGIGLQTAIEMAKQEFQVVMVVRDSEKSDLAFEKIKRESGSDCISKFYVDLASLQSIKNVANKIKKQYSNIDILINNAGVFSKKYQKTEDGIEKMLAINYLATFTLTNILLPVLNKKSGKIINLSSELFKRGKINPESIFEIIKFKGEQVYANSKLLVNYFSFELKRRLKDEGVSIFCVHPGVVGTDIFREYPAWFNSILNLFISKPKDGAKPVIALAFKTDSDSTNNLYFNKLKPDTSYKFDKQISELIWNETIQIVKLNNEQ